MWDVVGALGGVLALILTLGGIFLYGKKSAKIEVKAEQMEKSYANETERKKVDKTVSTMSDAESDSVRRRYSRD